jgi:dihydropteroate synthase
MNRKSFYWKLRTSELALGERTLIMGILNVTPDSFSDGGLFRDPDRALAHALELEEQGADIIDIGAESTRPGSTRISAEEEWQRLAPVLKRLRGHLQTPLSIDTYKSETAARALDYGIEIINDPSGLTFDASLAKTAVSANAGLILTHMRGTPETWAKLPPLPDAPGAIARDLEATVNRARRAGVEHNRIVIDPGLGFGKRGEQNAEILAHLNELARLDLPLLAGPSRKSFLHQKSSEETLFATAAAVTAAILKGVHIVRVHDVKEMRAVALVADEIARAAAVVRVSLERPAQHAKMAHPEMRRPAVGRGMAPEIPRPPRPPLLRPPQEKAEAPPEQPMAEAAPPADRSPERRERSESRPPQKSGPRFDRGRSAPPRNRDFREKEGAPRRGSEGAPRRGSEGAPRRGSEGPPRRGKEDERRPARPVGDRPREQGDRRFPPRKDAAGRPPGNRPPGDRSQGDRFRDRDRGPRGDRPQGQEDRRGARSGPPRPQERSPGPRNGDQRGPGPRSGGPRSGDERGAGNAGPRGPRPPKRVFRKRP